MSFMKIHWLFLLGLTTTLHATDQSKIDWNTLKNFHDTLKKSFDQLIADSAITDSGTLNREHLENQQKRFIALRHDEEELKKQAERFAQNYPTNPHLGEALLWSLSPSNNPNASLEARKAILAQLDVKLAKIRASQDLSAEERLSAESTYAYAYGARSDLGKDIPISMNQLTKTIDSFKNALEISTTHHSQATSTPAQASTIARVEPDIGAFMGISELINRSGSTDLYRTFLSDISKSSNAKIAKMAQGAMTRMNVVNHELPLAFTAFDGTKIDLKDYRGKIVLIDFWATWCGPCKASFPKLKKIYTKYKDKGLVIIGISFDDIRKDLARYLAKTPLPWPTYFDEKGRNNEIGQKYGVTQIPQLWAIDKQGKVISMDWDEDQAEKELPTLLGA
jgi:thiol-disulfide isomerase/thioredoxin